MREMTTGRMDTAIKEKWVNALRSGDYDQTQGVLKTLNQDGEFHYCCLGVLCETLELPSMPRVTLEDGSPLRGTFQFKTGEPTGVMYALLSPHLRQKLGITTEQEALLTEMNDRGEPFEMIADWIEGHL